MISNFFSTIFRIIVSGISGAFWLLGHRFREFFGFSCYGALYKLLKLAFIVVGFIPFIALAFIELFLRMFVSIFFGLALFILGWIPLVGSIVRGIIRVIYFIFEKVFNILHIILTLPDIIFD